MNQTAVSDEPKIVQSEVQEEPMTKSDAVDVHGTNGVAAPPQGVHLLPASKASRLLGVSPKRLHQLVAAGSIGIHTVGGKRFFTQDAVNDLIESRKGNDHIRRYKKGRKKAAKIKAKARQTPYQQGGWTTKRVASYLNVTPTRVQQLGRRKQIKTWKDKKGFSHYLPDDVMRFNKERHGKRKAYLSGQPKLKRKPFVGVRTAATLLPRVVKPVVQDDMAQAADHINLVFQCHERKLFTAEEALGRIKGLLKL